MMIVSIVKTKIYYLFNVSNKIVLSSDPTILAECDLDETTREVLLSNIKRKLTSQAVKIRADIECACYGYEGIDAVKAALKAGLSLSTEELPIKINLIAPPLYGKHHIKFKSNLNKTFVLLSHDNIDTRKTRRFKNSPRSHRCNQNHHHRFRRCI